MSEMQGNAGCWIVPLHKPVEGVDLEDVSWDSLIIEWEWEGAKVKRSRGFTGDNVYKRSRK